MPRTDEKDNLSIVAGRPAIPAPGSIPNHGYLGLLKVEEQEIYDDLKFSRTDNKSEEYISAILCFIFALDNQVYISRIRQSRTRRLLNASQ